jgi:hypothetical protein
VAKCQRYSRHGATFDDEMLAHPFLIGRAMVARAKGRRHLNATEGGRPTAQKPVGTETLQPHKHKGGVMLILVELNHVRSGLSTPECRAFIEQP